MAAYLRGTLAAGAAGVVLCLPATALGATFNVSTTADGVAGSLREAFSLANTNPNDDEIVLAAGATYQLTVCGPALEEDLNADGDLDHTATESLTITGNGATIQNTCPDERLFENASTGPLNLNALTLTGGDAADDGGAVTTLTGPVSVASSTFLGNSADSNGGAIRSSSAPVAVDASRFEQNEAGSDGGGIETTSGTIAVTGSTFTANSSGTDGGALETSVGDMTVRSSVFTGNEAGSGGGAIRAADFRLIVEGSVISGNTAQNDGGGITTSVGAISVRDTTISGNTSTTGDGGALRIADGEISIVNSTLSGNRVLDGEGGAVEFFSSTQPLEIANSTIVDNSAAPAGDGDAAIDANAAKLSSSIIARNPTGDCFAFEDPFDSSGFNIDSDGSCNLDAAGDRPNTDPQLGPLADNGGPGPTHLPALTSPAVDGGIANSLALDQRGLPRTVDLATVPNPAGSDGTDIGSVEVAGAACRGAIVPSKAGTDADDAIAGTEGPDSLAGNGGNDTIEALGGDDCALGDAGDDTIRGGAGNDELGGAAGKDKLRGQAGNDRQKGEDGNDNLSGGGGKDKLVGGAGKDTIKGAKGKDRLKGNAGKDKLKAADGKRDKVNCGGGKDKAVVDEKDRVARNCDEVVTR
jgi:predicted outer membrane repeat protein